LYQLKQFLKTTPLYIGHNMALDKPFSSQDATLRIFDNSTAGQQTALNTLISALEIPNLDSAQRQALFATYVSTVGTSGTYTVTAATGLPNSNVDGASSGTWTHTATGSSGTFSSTSSSGTAAAGTLTILVKGTLTSTTVAPTTFVYAKGAPSAAGTVSATFVAGVGNSALIDCITAYGDTGDKTIINSAQLLNRQGTFKGKGSTDAGEWSFDLLEKVADAGQILVNKAKDDRSLNANRVFIQSFNSSNDGSEMQRWYAIGMVTSITSSTSKDAFVPLKVSVALQDGQVRSPVAIAGI
jgi:hypothetical protein